jgi:hypothetical protein
MTGRRMNWAKARLRGRPITDFRHEYDTPDRAQRWLDAVDRRRQERRNVVPSRRQIGITANSTSGAPW